MRPVTPILITSVVGGLLVCAALAANKGVAVHPDPGTVAEVVNGFAIALSSDRYLGVQPRLSMKLMNASKEPFDLVEGPMFLEVEGPPNHWRSLQNEKWGSDKVDKAYRFEPGHVESETERVSRFGTLKPGTYHVRVCMTVDRGMVRSVKSPCVWIGTVRSNTVEITVPPTPAPTAPTEKPAKTVRPASLRIAATSPPADRSDRKDCHVQNCTNI